MSAEREARLPEGDDRESRPLECDDRGSRPLEGDDRDGRDGAGASGTEVILRVVDPRPAGVAGAVAPDGREVAVFAIDGELHAFSGRCLHRGGPLADGYVRDGIVTCPYHWWRYDIRTGRCLSGSPARLERYPVEPGDGGELLVRLPPAPARPPSIRERLLALARATPSAEPPPEPRPDPRPPVPWPEPRPRVIQPDGAGDRRGR